MGKDWDKAVPSIELWTECLRVLKPGAFAFVMSAPRSDVQMHMIENLTKAGFRVDFSPLYHSYASGFPKSMNVEKTVLRGLSAQLKKEHNIDDVEWEMSDLSEEPSEAAK